MSQPKLSVPGPGCGLRVLDTRNSQQPGVASATATATGAQLDFDKALIIEEIKAAREKVACATNSATHPKNSATLRPFSGGSSCGLNESDSSKNVITGPWEPATPEQLTEERRRVLEEPPRKWWWRPRYQLAELERGGMEREQAVAAIRAEVMP